VFKWSSNDQRLDCTAFPGWIVPGADVPTGVAALYFNYLFKE